MVRNWSVVECRQRGVQYHMQEVVNKAIYLIVNAMSVTMSGVANMIVWKFERAFDSPGLVM